MQNYNSKTMFKNYFKIAWRNLVKHKAYSLINVSGLAIGLSCFIFIAMYVVDELSYDRFYPNAENIYRVNSDVLFGGTELHITQSSDMIGQTLKKDFPQVTQYTRIFNNYGSKLIKKGNSFIQEDKVAHFDSTFFEVFKQKAIAGDLQKALDEPNTVVITRSAAEKYFGSTNVVGKTLETNDDKDPVYKITGVIADMPENSHFNFDFLFSMKNVNYQFGQHLSFNFHTYLLFKPGTDAKAFQKNIDQYVKTYIAPQAKQYMNINSMDEFRKAGNKLDITLMPLEKIHLYSTYNFEISPVGNIQYVYIFSAVALLILLIACINFMNLTTAKSTTRAREVGIRKVLGTEKKSLIAQFLFEAIMIAYIALIVSIILVALLMPYFNSLAGKSLTFGDLLSPWPIICLLAIPLVTGLLAGSYPAFYLSSFRPIQVLKGKLSSNAKGGIRSALVVTQFAISIILIIGTIVIYRQLNYIRNKSLGFEKEQVLVIDNAFELKKNIDAFKNNLLIQPGVKSATVSSFLPVTNSSRSDQSYSTAPVMTAESGFDMQSWQIDYDYFSTLGMEIAEGRNFSKDFGTDTAAVILNEAAIKVLGYSEPLGRKIYSPANDYGPAESYTVVGVVKDFHFESLRKDIAPVSFFLRKSSGMVSAKLSARDVGNVIASAEKSWKQMAPSMPFSYRFLDDSFNDMYKSESRVGNIGFTFSLVAIFIACLGLFGLATFIAEQRTKEIGIRKVLGASVSTIINMLSIDFVKLVAIAFVLAAPLAWLGMHRWLQDFAYRADLSWWIFVVAAGISLFIAVATISIQAFRAAVKNPVKSLRTE